MSKAWCPNCQIYPETLLCFPLIGIDEKTSEPILTGVGVFLNNDGTCTNQRADGAFGVPDHIREMAEEDESPVCATCYGYVDWKHDDQE